MKLNYDVATDSLYIHLNDTVATDSDEVADGVVPDFAADGSLVGIDVQSGRVGRLHLPTRSKGGQIRLAHPTQSNT